MGRSVSAPSWLKIRSCRYAQEDVVALYSRRLRSAGRRAPRQAGVGQVDHVQQQRHVPVFLRLLVLSRSVRRQFSVRRRRTLVRIAIRPMSTLVYYYSS